MRVCRNLDWSPKVQIYFLIVWVGLDRVLAPSPVLYLKISRLLGPSTSTIFFFLAVIEGIPAWSMGQSYLNRVRLREAKACEGRFPYQDKLTSIWPKSTLFLSR